MKHKEIMTEKEQTIYDRFFFTSYGTLEQRKTSSKLCMRIHLELTESLQSEVDRKDKLLEKFIRCWEYYEDSDMEALYQKVKKELNTKKKTT